MSESQFSWRGQIVPRSISSAPHLIFLKHRRPKLPLKSQKQLVPDGMMILRLLSGKILKNGKISMTKT